MTVTVPYIKPVNLTVSLGPGQLTGQMADWWIYAETPDGVFSWTYPDGWAAGFSPLQLPLIDVPPFTLWDSGLPEGEYTFHFGIDENVDGNRDMT